jgi:hypothetical protein
VNANVPPASRTDEGTEPPREGHFRASIRLLGREYKPLLRPVPVGLRVEPVEVLRGPRFIRPAGDPAFPRHAATPGH